MGNFFDRATNPQQYDFDDLKWSQEIDIKSPTREFMYYYISTYKSLWKEADILDVGCGTGWLANIIKESGAKSVTGIDPSKKNILTAKERFPELHSIQSSFEQYQDTKKYDIIIASMVLPHIADIHSFFKKTNNLLKQQGELHAIIPNYNYFKKPRTECVLDLEIIDENTYVSQINRPTQGIMADIVRKPIIYIKEAIKQGLTNIETIDMKPTPYMIEQVQRYKENKDVVVAHMIRLRKK